MNHPHVGKPNNRQINTGVLKTKCVGGGVAGNHKQNKNATDSIVIVSSEKEGEACEWNSKNKRNRNG